MENQSGFPVFLNELAVCIENKLSIPALYLALPLPNIAGRIEFSNKPEIKHHGEMHREWCRLYMDDWWLEENRIDKLWHLRCSFLHSFGMPSKNEPQETTIFTMPEFGGVLFHRSKIGDVDVFDTIEIAREIYLAAVRWYKSAMLDNVKMLSLRNTLRVYPNGFHRLIVGYPVLVYGAGSFNDSNDEGLGLEEGSWE